MLIPMLALALALTAPAAVQQDDQQKPAPKPPAAERPQPAPEPPNPLPATNVRIELTISISGPGGAPAGTPKTATLHVVDRDSGRIRMGHGGTVVVVAGQPPQPSPMFNVDASPHVVANGRIRVNLGFEYRPEAGESKDGNAIHVNERLSAVLEDGKPMVVSQTSDPASDRVVKVELKATIVK